MCRAWRAAKATTTTWNARAAAAPSGSKQAPKPHPRARARHRRRALCIWGLAAPNSRPGENLMPRNILPDSSIHPAIRDKVAGYRADFVKEVQDVVAATAV